MTPPTTGTTAARTAPGPWASPTHRRSVLLVLAIVAIAILFDGYDLVIYGAVLPTLLADPSQIGALTPETAGTLGAWALIGVLVGALTAGAVGDRFGRKRVMLAASVWFSAGMAATALTTSATTFGLFRFLTGVGVGMIVATGGAIIAEFAPRGRKNLFNAIVYSGVPAGGVVASVLAILLLDAIGWRGLFLIGATPLLFLVPMIVVALPESPRWLVSAGRTEEALAVCERHGLPQADFIPADAHTTATHPTPEHAATAAPAPAEKVGYAALFSRTYAMGAILIGFMSFTGLLLTYGLNTWLPKIMENAGGQAKGSLLFLVVLNGGAIAGGLAASVIGGVIIGAGLSSGSALYIFAGLALVGSVLTALVPRSPAQEQRIELLPEPERSTASTPVAATK